MIATIMFNKIKTFLLVFVNLFRRAMCCLRRRRRSYGDGVPLMQVGVVSNDSMEVNQEVWKDWEDEAPKTIQDHIDLYRKQVYSPSMQEKKEEDPMQLFEDMAPKITKTKKVLISTDRNETRSNPSRLNFAPENVPIMPTSELGEWDENSGWEGENMDWDTQQALREKRRLERERRQWEQQQKRQEKMSSRSLGARISS